MNKLSILILIIGIVHLISGIVLLGTKDFSNQVLGSIYASVFCGLVCSFMVSYIKIFHKGYLVLGILIIAQFIGGSLLISQNNPDNKNENKGNFIGGIMLIIISIINMSQMISCHIDNSIKIYYNID